MKKILGAISALFMMASATAAAPQVHIDSGNIAGVAIGDIETYLGVPYAAPPVGPLRWRAPQPVKPWRGVRKTIRYGNDCMQKPFPSDAAPLGTKPAEDCLTVNIWRPSGLKSTDRLPVLFWIFGGGNVNGGASPEVYSGESFARHGVIFVSFNWRVGRFGFFEFPELSRLDADHDLLANYGYMDSIAALQWVQRNIAAFGGDPKRVTLYGQSAGAGQVKMLLTSRMADGLYSQAIIQSGGATEERPLFQVGTSSSAALEKLGVNFARRWNIDGTGAAALKKLRALSAEQVTDGINLDTSATQRDTYSGPVRDGKLLTESLESAVAAGRGPKVPLLIGSTTADNSRINARTLDEAWKEFGAGATLARAAYLTNPSADPQYLLREMGRDFSYGEPVRFVASRLRSTGLPVYVYRFAYVADSMRKEWAEGPPHATDIPYAMNTVRAKYGDKLTNQDMAMAQMEHSYWVNFVRTGNPNGSGLPNWPVYDPGADKIMYFSADGVPRAVADPYKARLDAVAAKMNRH